MNSFILKQRLKCSRLRAQGEIHVTPNSFTNHGRYGFGPGYYRPYIVRTRRGFQYVYGWNDPFLYGSGFGRGYDVRSYTVYSSGIDLKIEKSESGERLFEGKAEAMSTSNRLQYLVPNLVEAMFTDFPGNSGETLRISIKPEETTIRKID